MFIGFTKFYKHFFQSFSKITALLIFLLKITRLYKNLASKVFKANDKKVFDDNNGKPNKIVINLSKNSMHIPNIKIIKEYIFLTLNAKKVFNYL